VPNSSRTDTSKERIYQDLRRSIILGHLTTGEKLNLEILADQYQTSVTPVREALQMLAQEDLITSIPHSGYFVTQVTFKELTDLLDLREILEIAAVSRAAEQITEKQLKELEQVHVKQIDGQAGSYERAVIENRQLHYLIALASGNRELAETLGRVHDRLARFFVFVHSPAEVEQRHSTLIKALRAHDQNLAVQTMLEEINETREITLTKVIENQGNRWILDENKPEMITEEPNHV
jgi:DNA-binding GntR family transcriptional regulator